MLTINNLCAGYGGRQVISDISLRLEQGESIAIIGPNGCGKTTLLRAVAGLLPFQGEVLLDGVAVTDIPRRELAKKLAMLSQLTQVYFDYNIYDTVMMGRYAYGKRRLLSDITPDDRETVREALESVRLWELRDRGISTISGGQLQRVFLAKLLSQQPDIVLLDEPTNHLDLGYQVELIDFLRRWSAEGGKSIVGVLHDINLAVRLTDRLMLLCDGRIEAMGTPAQVLRPEVLQRVYGIDVTEYMRNSLKVWNNI